MSHLYPEGAPAGYEDQTPSNTDEEERCSHKPDGYIIDGDNRVLSTCEECGAPLEAVEVDSTAMSKNGELCITEWREA